MRTVSNDNGDISAKMPGGAGGDRNSDALARYFRAGTWYLLRPQHQMDVRSVHTAYTELV